ncbi:MAG: tRNA lysidine(34) synthetase TilS, partial [Chloroflexota bacterium]
MRGFEPFESKPTLAAAVSGGPDSLALCLLAQGWARARGGRVLALTVDHRLRPESAKEARQVARWLKARGIAHRVLVWDAPKPGSNRAAAAREARYRLMIAAAARRGILHLLLAHHLDDQTETLLLRLARGSGVDGLAAMAPAVALGDLRLLRPLLDVPKSRLVATLKAMRQDFVEDPSNRSAASARARLRQPLAAIADAGLTARRLAETARRMGRARHALELATAALMARAVAIHPAGYVLLDPLALGHAPEELVLRLIARCLTTVSGETYPPRLA